MRQYFLVSKAQRACSNAPGELQVATVSAVTKAYRFAKGHSVKIDGTDQHFGPRLRFVSRLTNHGDLFQYL